MINEKGSQSPDQEHELHFAKRVGRFFSATLISRVLGYLRDASVAYVFGGGAVTDSFYTAFRVSNLFRSILGEGALASSFIPIFSNVLKKNSKEEIQDFLHSFFTSLFVVLAFITFLGMVFAPHITSWIASGFQSSPEKFRMTVSLTRWMFPFFLFICLAALVGSVLNSLKHFFIPAVAPAMLSVSEIAYLFIGIPLIASIASDFSVKSQVIGLSIAVVAGGAGNLLMQIPALLREKYTLQFKWNWSNPHSIEVSKLMIPALLGLSVEYVNTFVNMMCATFLADGSVTALYNSNRLVHLPLALFGVSVATVSLPMMSDHSAEHNFRKLGETLNQSLRTLIFIMIPASFGLMVLAKPIITVLFEHGKFSASSTLLTAQALWGYSAGLVAYAMVKILANAFYALREPKIPVRIAMACIGINIILNLTFMKPLGVGGLSLATALASWINVTWLFLLIRKRIKIHGAGFLESIGGKSLIATGIKTLTASAGLLIYVKLLSTFWPSLNPAATLLLGAAGGTLLFIFLAKTLKIEELLLFKSILGIPDSKKD